MNYNYKPDDVVFVCWTHLDRWTVIQKDDIVNIEIDILARYIENNIKKIK